MKSRTLSVDNEDDVAGHAHPAGCAHTAGPAHPAGRAHAGDAFFADDAHLSGDVNFAVGADPGTDATDLATGDLAHPVFIADSLGRSTPRQVEQITLQKDDRVPQRHHFVLNSNC